MSSSAAILALGLGPPYERFLPALAIDLLAIGLLAYGIYFRRHHRRDLLLAYVCFNVGLFSVVTVLMLADASLGTSLALGLGLFGALSLIRLRSAELRYHEIAYFFSALALAIVNAVDIADLRFTALMSFVVLAAMFVMDRFEPERPIRRLALVLDEIYPDETVLRAELERRLGATVVAVEITEIDYVRDITRLEAEYVRDRSAFDPPRRRLRRTTPPVAIDR
ncbi:MAG: DUF4956 domain-containing protein [Thermoleophilia bacterium]|nr:DUF4956 domain-containing protein [Thermoleophilia bacterium]